MDNKLSELSKPVAYDYQIAGACIADGHNTNGQWVHWSNELRPECPPDWMIEEGQVKDLKPRYSQEYVSALLAELEAKDKRIAELEVKLATPVRLPDVLFIKVSGSAVPVMHAERVKERVHAAGFKCVGDE